LTPPHLSATGFPWLPFVREFPRPLCCLLFSPCPFLAGLCVWWCFCPLSWFSALTVSCFPSLLFIFPDLMKCSPPLFPFLAPVFIFPGGRLFFPTSSVMSFLTTSPTPLSITAPVLRVRLGRHPRRTRFAVVRLCRMDGRFVGVFLSGFPVCGVGLSFGFPMCLIDFCTFLLFPHGQLSRLCQWLLFPLGFSQCEGTPLVSHPFCSPPLLIKGRVCAVFPRAPLAPSSPRQYFTVFFLLMGDTQASPCGG